MTPVNIPVCFPPICDPHLLTVNNIFISFLLSLCFYTSHIRACSRLCYTVSLKEIKMQSVGGIKVLSLVNYKLLQIMCKLFVKGLSELHGKIQTPNKQPPPPPIKPQNNPTHSPFPLQTAGRERVNFLYKSIIIHKIGF